MSGNKSMADIWKQIEKQHGDEGLFVGSDTMTTYSDAISTGSHLLDDALGIWGVPRGHIVQYAGFQSSGKTLLSFTTIAEWQKKDPRNWAMFIDAEFSYVPSWARSLGVDTDRLYVYKENKGAAIFDRLVGIPAKADRKGEIKKTKQGILDLEIEAIRNGQEGGTGLGVIVLDSVAALQVPMEEASKAGKANIALVARFLPPELRKLTPMLTETGVTFIAINQLRYRPDVMYGDPTDSPGGTALKFACAQMINLAIINTKDSRIEDGGVRIGHHIRAKVQKNKKAPPYREAEFAVKYTEGIVNKHCELRDLAGSYGVIERPNNKTWVLDGVKYNGKDAMAEALKDSELQNSVLERVKEAKINWIPGANKIENESSSMDDIIGKLEGFEDKE